MTTTQQAVITGAASGIGAEFARTAAARSFDLLLADRDAPRLTRMAGELRSSSKVNVETFVTDLATLEGIEALAAAITGLQRIDLLINCAGLSEKASFLETDVALLTEMVGVHCLSTMILCRVALDRMVEAQSGTLINVASLAGLVRGGVSPNYGATKAYVVWLSRMLNSRYRREGVYVQALCPGHTRTDLLTSDERRGIPELFFSDAESVVRHSWSAVRRHKAICIPGLRHRLLYYLGRTGLALIAWKVLLKLEFALGVKTPRQDD